MQSTGRLKFENEEYNFCAEDLVDCGEIGRGNFGAVNKMLFRRTGRVMAVKRIRLVISLIFTFPQYIFFPKPHTGGGVDIKSILILLNNWGRKSVGMKSQT